MKKFSVFGIIILLVMVSCNNPSDLGSTDSADDPIQYTADGRPMVAVSLGTGSSSRALTDTLAKAGFDLYEAVFKDPTASPAVYYRKAWNKGEVAKIYLPNGDYTTSDKAILLVGASKDKTLLAVGIVTSTSTGTTVTAATTSITFTLNSLVTDISSTYTPTSSTFAITTTGSDTAGNPSLLKTTSDGYPYFIISASQTTTTAETATYTLRGSSPAALDNYTDGLYVKATTGLITSAGISSTFTTDDTFMPIVVDAAFGTIVKANGTLINTSLPINITVPISPKPGLSKIWIDIPVCGLNAAANGFTWHIKGGFNNSVPDGGKASNSLGGAILLGTGNFDGITINSTW